MAVWIPLRQTDVQFATEQTIRLDNTQIRVRGRYVSALDRWVIWLLSPSDDVLVGPLRLVTNVDLLRQYHHIDGVPPGQLFVYGVDRLAPDRDTLDESVKLLYRPEADV